MSLPGSKSLTNRSLLLAALCDQPVTLTGALFSEDTRLMSEALRRLRFTVEQDPNTSTLRVADQHRGFSDRSAAIDLFVGLAGTAARFLTALCAAAPGGVYRLDGIPQMRKRPMKGLLQALRALGADIRCLETEGYFPIEIHARGLSGGPVAIDASESSQLLSALLMISPLASAPLEITLSASVRRPFVEMTLQLMREFGHPSGRFSDSSHVSLDRGSYRSPGNYVIEPDATAASYFLALPLVTGGAVTLPGLRGAGGGLQGDTRFASVAERVGLVVQTSPDGLTATRGRDVKLRGVTQDFSEFSDTFLTLAAIAPLLDGPTRISGIAHSRQQETDRVAGMARELTRLGQKVIETEDALEIHPQPLRAGETIETYGDHRFAMSFGILGCHDLHGDGRSWLAIKDPGCCAKTFPNFFELLEDVRKNSLAAP